MQTNFSINVNVQIGVTSELAQMVLAILANKPAQHTAIAAPAEATTEAEPAASKEQPAEEKPKRGRKPKATTEEAAAPKEEPEAPAEEAAPAEAATDAPAMEAQAEDAKPLTEEDIRAAMHRTRQRIEGEGYKENTDSEGYKKYHKQLTAQFKNIAALLGAEKPSGLPEEQRASFIEQCDELIIGEDGTITTKCPF